VQKEKKNLAR